MNEKQTVREIDVIAMAMKVLQEKKLLLKFILVAGCVGVVVAFTTPKHYTSEVILAPELSSGGLGLSDNLAEMASSFGIDLGSKSSMDAIYPEIYPDIFQSTDFVTQLFDVPVRLKDDPTTRTYLHHLETEQQMALVDYPKYWFVLLKKKYFEKTETGGMGEVDPYWLSKKERELCDGISDMVTCVIDKKTSQITLTFTDQDPMVAAIMVDTLQRRLQAYITDYRTKKARVDYEYYDTLVTQSYAAYQQKSRAYSAYSDSHMNSVLEAVKVKEESLRGDMENAYSSYSAMLQLREQAMAKIQSRTPAFTIIQSSKVTFKPSSRPRVYTALIYVFLGVIADVAWVLYLRQWYVRKRIRKNQ